VPDERSGNVISRREIERKKERKEGNRGNRKQRCRGEKRVDSRERKAESGGGERPSARAKPGTVICKEAGVCFGRWQQSAAVRDNPPVIKTINPSAD